MIARLVEQVGDDERQLADGGAMAFGEVVDDEDVVAAVGELFGGVRADVAGPAGDEYAHVDDVSCWRRPEQTLGSSLCRNASLSEWATLESNPRQNHREKREVRQAAPPHWQQSGRHKWNNRRDQPEATSINQRCLPG